MDDFKKQFLYLQSELNKLVYQYSEIPISKLTQQFNINSNAKNCLNLLAKKILSENSLHYLLNTFHIKTIKLDSNGKLKEAMSLPAFKYCDLVQEVWETSKLHMLFLNEKFAFVVFQKKRKETYLKKIVLWKMPQNVLETGVKRAWDTMIECLNCGNIVKYIDDRGRYHTFFPGQTDNPYVHVRPHGKNRNDTLPLPVQDKLTGLIVYPKHSFWLNRPYIIKIINQSNRSI